MMQKIIFGVIRDKKHGTTLSDISGWPKIIVNNVGKDFHKKAFNISNTEQFRTFLRSRHCKIIIFVLFKNIKLNNDLKQLKKKINYSKIFTRK